MAKEFSYLYVRMSPKLKDDFKAMCDENEIDMSDKVREVLTNLVRSHKRQTGKPDNAKE